MHFKLDETTSKVVAEKADGNTRQIEFLQSPKGDDREPDTSRNKAKYQKDDSEVELVA